MEVEDDNNDYEDIEDVEEGKKETQGKSAKEPVKKEKKRKRKARLTLVKRNGKEKKVKKEMVDEDEEELAMHGQGQDEIVVEEEEEEEEQEEQLPEKKEKKQAKKAPAKRGRKKARKVVAKQKEKYEERDDDDNEYYKEEKIVVASVPKKKPRPNKKNYLHPTNPSSQYREGRVERAKRQRIYLMSAQRENNDAWNFEVEGTTGNIYLVEIDRSYLKCRCMDFKMHHRTCKHLYFIIVEVAQYDEILDNISNTPELDDDTYDKLDMRLVQRLRQRLQGSNEKAGAETGKSEEAGQNEQEKIDFGDDPDCAICFEGLSFDNELECTTCKKYLHRDCMTVWLEKNSNCPLCRGNWQEQRQAIVNLHTAYAVNNEPDRALAYLDTANIELNNDDEN